MRDLGKSPNYALLDRIKKVSGSSNQKELYSPKPERNISPFGQIGMKDHKRGNSHLEEVKNKEIEQS